MQDLSEKLKALREKRSLTQSQVAEMLGITSSAVSSYECAIRTPTVQILERFASLYHVTTDYLLGVSQSNRHIIELDGLSPKEIEAVRSLVEVMKESHSQ